MKPFIDDLHRSPSVERFFAINAGFHAMLAACSGNRFLLQAMEAQNALRRLTEYADYGELEADALLKSCHPANTSPFSMRSNRVTSTGR